MTNPFSQIPINNQTLQTFGGQSSNLNQTVPGALIGRNSEGAQQFGSYLGVTVEVNGNKEEPKKEEEEKEGE